MNGSGLSHLGNKIHRAEDKVLILTLPKQTAHIYNGLKGPSGVRGHRAIHTMLYTKTVNGVNPTNKQQLQPFK